MSATQTAGPLIIIGGGEDREGGMTILREFVRLSGGPKARVVMLSAASEDPELQDRKYREAFEKIGVADFRALVTNSRADADRARAVGVLDGASGVFFSGGDQKRITRTLLGTKVAAALHARRAEGMVVAGTSAGASMMTEVMIDEGESESCPRAGLVDLAPGMGFLPGAIVDQHFAQRGRLGRLLAAVARRPELIGLGLGEDTAMIVEGDAFRALGSGVVTALDGSGLTVNTLPDSKPDQPLTLGRIILHTVAAGGRFDLASRSLLPVAQELAAR